MTRPASDGPRAIRQALTGLAAIVALAAGLIVPGRPVVLETAGQVAAIVTELNLSGGDNAMIYRSFPE